LPTATVRAVCSLRRRRPARTRSAAPSLGQDNRTVLREIAGYTDEEIDAMEAEHVI